MRIPKGYRELRVGEIITGNVKYYPWGDTSKPLYTIAEHAVDRLNEKYDPDDMVRMFRRISENFYVDGL